MIRDRFLETVLIKAWVPQDENFGYYMDQAEPVLDDRVLTNVAWALNEEQLDTFMDLASKEASEDVIYEYLSSVIPNYEEFIWKVYDDFEKMYIENFRAFSEPS